MKIKILFFGNLKDIVKSDELYLSDIKNSDELNKKIHDQYPEMKNMTYRIAVNKELINSNTDLNDNDEIAFLPPFAGG